MLAEAEISLQQLADKTGFEVQTILAIAKGDVTAGPELWMLVSLAEAMNFDLNLNFSKIEHS